VSEALIIDAGNTRVTAVSWPGASLEVVGSWATSAVVAKEPTVVAELDDLLAGFASAMPVLVSVVPEVTTLLREHQADLVEVDHRCELPFAMAVETPAEVGPDRLCNMAAASAAGYRRSLVVDLGTATTFDLLVDGVFIGGLIAPGLEFSARSLGNRAARLKAVPFGPRPLAAGTDTTAAMAAGAWHTGIGGVETVIAGLTQKYGPLQVVLTGGLGFHLAADDRLCDPEWTLRGAAVLAGLCS